MLGRNLVRKVGMTVAASALLTGVLGVAGITAVHAVSESEYYVAPAADGGNDQGGANTCTLAGNPCATIGQALREEATLADGSPGSVINLAKGTYESTTADDFFNAVTTGNSGVTIVGKTNKKGLLASTVAPQTCAQLASGSTGVKALAAFVTGEDGITLENFVLSGAAVSGCPGYQAGVEITDGTTGDAVVGVQLESGAHYGILTDDNADSTIISNVLTSIPCSTVVTGPNTGLNAGWTTPANLKVKADPKCAKFIESSHGAATGVYINGVEYCMTVSASKLTLVLTGIDVGGTCTAITNSGGTEIATGATVSYNTSTASFLNYGIACNAPFQIEDQTTDCAISDNTVTGSNVTDSSPGAAPPTYVLTSVPAGAGFPPAGILVTGGAVGDVDGNTVSGVADSFTSTTGVTTNDGIGIGLLPDAIDGCSAGGANGSSAGEHTVVGVNDLNSPNTGHGNTLSSNDVGIAVSGNSDPGCTDTNPGYEVNSNTVSSANEAGIALTDLGNTYGGTLATGLEANSVSGVTEGVGIEAEGITNQIIGGPLASEGNTETGSGVGFVLAPCASTACATEGPPEGIKSSGNLIENNSFTGNIAYGVLVVGSYQVDELAQQIPTLAASLLSASGNTFDANQWGTPTSATNGTLPSEINGSEVEDGTGWGGGCTSELGDCVETGGVLALTYEGANQTLGASNPGTGTLSLELCNSGATSVDLPRGTEITFNTPNNLTNVDPQETNDGGTFFVTADAIITGDATCANPDLFNTVTVQAIAPAKVGTLSAPSGQNYILGTGDTVYANANGAAAAVLNTYGTGGNGNSCTPVGSNGIPNVFGETNPPFTQYSTTLQASTGGVNATYTAC
jgi:hypothetical protein